MNDAIALVGDFRRSCGPEEIVRVGGEPSIGQLKRGRGRAPVVRWATSWFELTVAIDPMTNDAGIVHDARAISHPGIHVLYAVPRADPSGTRFQRRSVADRCQKGCRPEKQDAEHT